MKQLLIIALKSIASLVITVAVAIALMITFMYINDDFSAMSKTVFCE